MCLRVERRLGRIERTARVDRDGSATIDGDLGQRACPLGDQPFEVRAPATDVKFEVPA